MSNKLVYVFYTETKTTFKVFCSIFGLNKIPTALKHVKVPKEFRFGGI